MNKKTHKKQIYQNIDVTRKLWKKFEKINEHISILKIKWNKETKDDYVGLCTWFSSHYNIHITCHCTFYYHTDYTYALIRELCDTQNDFIIFWIVLSLYFLRLPRYLGSFCGRTLSSSTSNGWAIHFQEDEFLFKSCSPTQYCCTLHRWVCELYASIKILF